MAREIIILTSFVVIARGCNTVLSAPSLRPEAPTLRPKMTSSFRLYIMRLFKVGRCCYTPTTVVPGKVYLVYEYRQAIPFYMVLYTPRVPVSVRAGTLNL